MNGPAADKAEQDLKRLLDEAMKQPGVADLMAVYEVWREAEEVCNVQRAYDEKQYVVSLSDVSTPLASVRL